MVDRKRKILHIAVHLGGGVGKAILGAATYPNEQFETKIIILEEPEKRNIINKAQKEGIKISICPSEKSIEEQMETADIVVINWWNHPLMSKFLMELPKIKIRMTVWVHVNGCTYPYLPFTFLNQFDYIFFTTKYSYENILWSKEELEIIREKSAIVLGCGNFNPIMMNPKQEYQRRDVVRVGYVGTLSYSKINKNYVQYCEKAVQYCKNIKFIMAGDMDPILSKDIEDSPVKDKFEFLGYAENMGDLYLSLDILGYILNVDNFGTTENVILEAMAYGIPIIAYDGGVERAIIDDQVNGFLVRNPEEFAACVNDLAKDVGLQRMIGQAGREKVCAEYSCEKNIKLLLACCEKLCGREKRVHDFTGIYGDKPVEWFLYFTGEDREIFEGYMTDGSNEEWKQLLESKPIYKGESKSSIRHFLKYFPEDKDLQKMAIRLKLK